MSARQSKKQHKLLLTITTTRTIITCWINSQEIPIAKGNLLYFARTRQRRRTTSNNNNEITYLTCEENLLCFSKGRRYTWKNMAAFNWILLLLHCKFNWYYSELLVIFLIILIHSHTASRSASCSGTNLEILPPTPPLLLLCWSQI